MHTYKGVDGKDVYILEHHGIKGQKWGTRHGPPYPLSSKEHAAVVKGKGGSGKEASKSQKKNATKNVGVATEAAAAGVAAAYIGIKKAIAVHQSNKYDNGQYLVNRQNEKKDPRNGLSIQSEKSIHPIEDMEKVNPSYDKSNAHKTNCSKCTFAMEMRRRGYDVSAGGDRHALSKGMSADILKNMWTDKNGRKRGYNQNKLIDEEDGIVMRALKNNKNNKNVYADSTLDEMAKHGAGARGEINVVWAGWQGGHSMFWENDSDGKTTIYCSQSNQSWTGDAAKKLIRDSTWQSSVRRLDDCQPDLKVAARHHMLDNESTSSIKTTNKETKKAERAAKKAEREAKRAKKG